MSRSSLVRLALAAVLALLAPAALSGRAAAQAPADEPSAPVETPSADVSREAALELGLDFHVFSRRLTYEDDFYGFLRDFELSAGPAIGFYGRWYPAKHGTDRWPSMLGLELVFDRSFGIESDRAGLVRFPTVQRYVALNALGRFMVGRHAIVAAFGFGSHLFELRVNDPSLPANLRVPEVPSVEYAHLRYGLEARLALLDELAVELGAAFLQVLDAGGIQSSVWFPRSDVNGIELGGRIVYGLPKGLELHVGVEYRRYFFTMNPEVGDPFIAGGALDQYVFYSAGVAYRR